MPRGVKKENLPSKVCVVCERPFNWRKKWENNWDEVTTCSKSCNHKRRTAIQQKKLQMKRMPSASSVFSTAVVDELQPKTERSPSPVRQHSIKHLDTASHNNEPTTSESTRDDATPASDNGPAREKKEVFRKRTVPYKGQMYSDSNGPFVRSYSDDNEGYAPEQNVLEDIQLLSVNTFDILQSFEHDVVKSPAEGARQDDGETSSLLSSSSGDDNPTAANNKNTDAQRKADRKAAKKAKKAERRAQREGRGDKRTGQKTCDMCGKSVNLLIRCTVDESQKWKMVCGKCWNGVSGGVVDGDSNHPHYKYGGLWKNRREQQS